MYSPLEAMSIRTETQQGLGSGGLEIELTFTIPKLLFREDSFPSLLSLKN